MMRKKLRIGLVDLDTSHPGSFVPLLREMGHEVVAVYDGAAVYPTGYAAIFARDRGIAAVCDTVEEMVDLVDMAIVHSCNWDVHIERAKPFVAADKAVFIDKPLAGNVRDLRQIAGWANGGARVTGGSALRYCREAQSWLALGIPKEEWVYALAGCAVDEFNYGIHAYSLLHGLMGPGVRSVRWLGCSGGQLQMELRWEDGRAGVVGVGKTAGYLPFYANVVTQRRVDSLIVDNGKLYRSLLEAVLPYLAGEAPAPLPIGQLIEAELAAIAGKLSYERGGAAVELRDIPEDDPGYDGAVFAKSYKESKFPASN